MMKEKLKYLLPYFYAGLLLFVINLVFFGEQLKGKVLHQSDNINAIAMAREALLHFERTGKQTYWTNSMFGGMPTYQITNPGEKQSLIAYQISLFRLFITENALAYFMIFSMATFIGLCFFGVGPWLAFIGAFSTSYASNHIGLMSAGHLTKIATLGFMPMIVVGTYLLFNGKKLTGFFCYFFGLTACIRMNHIQMTYYLGLILAFYIAAEIFISIKTKKISIILKPLALLAAGTTIALLVNLSLLFSLQDYAKDTMRGGTILSMSESPQAISQTSSSGNGLSWDYAMQWSNGFTDLLSIIAPGAVGGSNAEEWSRQSNLADVFRRNNLQVNADFRIPLYWGSLPFTSGPDYMGIIVILLFLIGVMISKGPLKWFAIFSALFLILQSLGKNFQILNELLFNYLPYYNKFRTPNSILNILSSLLPIFAIYSLSQFINKSWDLKSLIKLFKQTVLPLGLLLSGLSILGPFLFNMISNQNDTAWQSSPKLYEALLDARSSYLRSDSFRSLFFLILASILLYAFGLKKLKKIHLLAGIGILIFFDLWPVAKRYLDAGDFEQKQQAESYFNPRPQDLEILKDNTLYYRVFDLSVDAFNNALPAYFHKNIGGYHAAKLRRYQDMIDYYFLKGNQSVLSMMNTKYIIDQNGTVQSNPGAMGNAWFVSRVQLVKTPDEEIGALGTVNLSEVAVILQNEFPSIAIAPEYNKNGAITLTSYAPDKLIYKSQCTNEQLAVFSDVWYGPNKGWHSTIDGKPVEHFRANYLLRAMKIPSGEHTIEFIFVPNSIIALNKISYAAGTAAGILIFILLYMMFRQLNIPPTSLIFTENSPNLKTISEIKKSKTKK